MIVAVIVVDIAVVAIAVVAIEVEGVIMIVWIDRRRPKPQASCLSPAKRPFFVGSLHRKNIAFGFKPRAGLPWEVAHALGILKLRNSGYNTKIDATWFYQFAQLVL
jgi:hypothetical protein